MAGGRFDRFTERARRILTLAQEEAQRFNHNYIGTEHLLLSLTREREGVAAKVLANLGVELDSVRSAVEHIVGRGERQPVGEIGLTPRAKKVIELAVDEARRLGHHYIGTEHLLLGLIREGEGIAGRVLESLDVDLEKVRSEVIKVLTHTSATPPDGERVEVSQADAPPAPRARRWPPWEYLAVQTVYREGVVRVQAVNGVEDPRFPAGEMAIHDVLRALGEEGWELSGITPLGEAGSGLYVFKRSRRS